MSVQQALSFCRNVFSYLNLGWITINFLEDGAAAFFQVEHDKLRRKDEAHEDDEQDDVGGKRHLVDVHELPDKPIEMATLSLNIPVSWALNKALLLHEISHYCAFMMPSTIEFYQKRDDFDEEDFESVFSSHGKLFSSIFAHCLSRFLFIPFETVQAALNEHGVPIYPLTVFNEAQMHQFISDDLSK
jgi:hypothetical protein